MDPSSTSITGRLTLAFCGPTASATQNQIKFNCETMIHSIKLVDSFTFDEEEGRAGDGRSDQIIRGGARVIGNVVDWIQPSVGPPTSVERQRRLDRLVLVDLVPK